MNRLFVSLILVFSGFIVNAQNYNNDSCKKKSSNQNEINTHIDINSRIILENTINSGIMLKTKKVNTNKDSFFEEFRKDNYSPRAVYFKVVAEELELINKEMLT